MPDSSSRSRSCCPACARSTRQRISGSRPTSRELFPRDLPWVERAWHYIDRFPEQGILVVVDAPTPELVDQASARLAAALETDREHFRAIDALQGDPFFARNALLYPPTSGCRADRRPDGAGGAADPGAERRSEPARRADRADFGLLGATNGFVQPDALARPMNMAADTVEDVLAGRPAHFSWRAAGRGQAGRAARTAPLHRRSSRCSISPRVEPGRAASEAIQDGAQRARSRRRAIRRGCG